MRLEKTMVSVPKVNPGDTVFWHSVRLLFLSNPLIVAYYLLLFSIIRTSSTQSRKIIMGPVTPP